MLMLSRKIGDGDSGEHINIRVRYSANPMLCRLLRNAGIDPKCLIGISDCITISPVRMDNPTGNEEEIVIGIVAAKHVDIVRSEIDNE